MPLIHVVLILIAVGVLLWLFNAKVTIVDATIKNIVNIVVIVAVVLWLLDVVGLFDGVRSIKTPHV